MCIGEMSADLILIKIAYNTPSGGTLPRTLPEWGYASCTGMPLINRDLDSATTDAGSMLSQRAITPSQASISHLYTLLISSKNPNHAAQLHAHLVTTNHLPLPLLHTNLIILYARLSLFPHALLAFTSIKPHATVASYTSLISALSRSSHPLLSLSLSLFSQLRAAGIPPNPFTFSAVLPACAAAHSPSSGAQVHALSAKHGASASVFVGTALLDMYSKSGDMASALKVFDEMPHRNLVSWNALLVGYLTNRLYTDAIAVFRDLVMDASIKTPKLPNQVSVSAVLSACSNTHGLLLGREVHAHAVRHGLGDVTYVRNSIIDMYAKCGCFGDALKMFDGSPDRDVVAWNIVMMGWVESDRCEEAVSCFRAMKREGISPDEASLSTALHASASLAVWCQAAAIHGQVLKTGYVSNLCSGSSLVTAYTKCGSLEDAYRAFQETRGHRNVVSWTAMIGGFQQHGHGDRAIELFEEMLDEGIKPNYVTFVCVLSACSHNGLIEHGFRYFESISQVHKMSPGNEHYACIVDMLGRAGRLEEAKQFICRMPSEPGVSVWGALLAACRNCNHLEMGKEVAQRLFEIEPDNPGSYVILANMYASRGKLEEANKVRRLMGHSGVRKDAGCSWIDVKNKSYTFTVHDKSHGRADEIYKTLEELQNLAMNQGYMVDATHDAIDVV